MRHFVCGALAFVLCASLPAAAQGQEKTVPLPPGVKLEGMPAIPQSIADGLAPYAQFRSAQMMAWNPAKRQVLINTTFANPQLHLVEAPGHDRRQLTWMPGAGISANLGNPAFDPADPNTFVFFLDPEGGEARSLYRFDLSTGQAALAVPARAHYSPVWSRSGKWVAYDSSERNGKDRDLYVVQPSDPKTRRKLADFEGPFSPQDWSPDGATLLADEIVANGETYLWTIDVKSGAKKAITARGGDKAGFYSARYSADGKKVYALSDRGEGEWRVWRCDVANCVWQPVTPAGTALDNPNNNGMLELSSDGTLLATIADKGSTTELLVIDLTTLKPRTLPAMAKGLVSQIHWRPASREIGFTFGSVKAQGDVYSIDTSLGTMTRWTYSETTFNAESLPTPEVVEWKSSDGVTISGILYRPAARFTGKRPVLVNIHGGPDQRAQAIFRGRSNYFLNEMGVALLLPNVRGSAGFGRKFTDLDNGRGREGAIKDVGAMLDWIDGRPDLDGSRVVLLGGSYGAWLALEAGIVYNSRIRGIIEGAGITDLVTFLEADTNPARQENRRAEYGDERDPQMRAFLESISPVTRAAELKKPTFILQPGKDPRVPLAQAQELLKAMKANGATVWYAEFTDANHDNFPGSAAANDWTIAGWIFFFKTFVLN